MVSKLQTPIASQVRAPAAKRAPARPAPAAEQPAQAAKGWAAKGAGGAQKLAAAQAASSSQVKLLKASIGDGPGVTTGFPAPRGVEVAIGADKRQESIPLPDGRVAKMDWDGSTLSVKNAKTGKTTELVGKDSKYFAQFQEEFQSTFKSISKQDLEFLPPEPGYDSQRGFTGVGSAGKLLSVSEGVSEYTGGAHPNNGTSLLTFDTATGKQVKLDALLSKEQFASIVKQVTTQLPKLKGEDGMDGQAFSISGDPKELIANNFSLSTDKNGKVQIDVAWESGVHAYGGQMAQFSFAAPTDAAFKQKVGIE